MKIICDHCGAEAEQATGSVNRSRKRGHKLYCGKKCSAIGRRHNKTVEQKKEEKRLYDIAYRNRNMDIIAKKKYDYFKKTYNSAKAAVERRKRSAKHVEYCRRPEYRKWKRQYDREHRAKKTMANSGSASYSLKKFETKP